MSSAASGPSQSGQPGRYKGILTSQVCVTAANEVNENHDCVIVGVSEGWFILVRPRANYRL